MIKKYSLLPAILLLLSSCNAISSIENISSSNNTISSEMSMSSSSILNESSSNLIEGHKIISHDDFNNYKQERFKTFGRNYIISNNLVLDNSASGGEYFFYGTESYVYMSPSTTLYLKVFIDDDKEGKTITISRNKKYKIASDLDKKIHYVRFVKLNSTFNGTIQISDISCDGDFVDIKKDYDLNIEFVGDSITCGAGVLGTSSDSCLVANTDVTKGYAYLSAIDLNASYSFNSVCGMCVSAKTALNFNMIETYPCYSYSYRGKYDFKENNDIVVLSLGTNDLYYVGSDSNRLNEFVSGYQELLQLIRTNNPDAFIICTYGLMNNSDTISNGIKQAIQTFSDYKVSYLQMPVDNKGAESHPGVDGAIKQKDSLVSYIRGMLNETK